MKVKFNQFKTKSTRNSDSKGSNIMKKNRKLTALLVAACMTIPMAATTFTVPMMANGATVTINSSVVGTDNYNGSYGTYKVAGYRVFSGNYNKIDENTSNFTVTGWGNKINVDNLIDALKQDSAFGVEESNLFYSIEKNNNSETATKVADIISSFVNDPAKANAFARLVASNLMYSLNNQNDIMNYADFKGEASANNPITINDVNAGYYVLVEPYAPSDNGNGSARTLGMLKVIGDDVTVSPKRSYPTINKEVKNEDTYGSVADYCIGEDVSFKITGTVPDTIDDYGAYYYVMTDTLGNAFDIPTSITINIGTASDEDSIKSITLNPTDSNTVIDADKNCRVSITNKVITISFEDIKAYDTEINKVNKDTKITVTYTAKLNSNAETGNNAFDNKTQQINKVKLTYLNNPNVMYYPKDDEKVDEITDANYLGTSVEKNVKVFTYQLNIDKIDGATQAKLEGVGFKIKRLKADSSGEYEYATFIDNKVTGWNEQGTELLTNASGELNMIGLDAGSYKLQETKPKDGYNDIEDVDIVIAAEFDANNNNALSTLTLNTVGSDDLANGIVTIEVKNNKGTTLPETGGIGTKIFYILGGTLVIGSGAALVIKKRMGKDEIGRASCRERV